MTAKDKDAPLDTCNAVKRYVDAKACCEADKKNAALEFICQNLKDVAETDAFNKLLDADPLAAIITSRQLVADTPLLFHVVLHWANTKYKDRGGEHLEMLLKKIPFAAASPDDVKVYLCDASIRRSVRLTNLMCDLWDAADAQRTTSCAENVWFGDITSLLKCPIKSAAASFFFVRQGYLFEIKANTHKHFAKHDKGLDVFLRVRRAELGWKHSSHALRQLHVKTCFWINVDCKKPYVKSGSVQIDLMSLKKDKEDAEWFGIEGFVPCDKLCKIVDSKKILLGVRLDIEKIRTAGSCPKEEEKCCCDCSVCCKPKKEEKKKENKCECCCAPKKEEKKPEKCCCVKECEDECKKKCCDKPCCEHKKKACEAKCEKDCAGKCEHTCSCCPKPKEESAKKPCGCAKCKAKAEKEEPKCACCEPEKEKEKAKKKKHEILCSCSVCSIKSTSEICKPKTSDKSKCSHSIDISICC